MSATTHIRQHNSLLAAAEKRALVWMASRLPRWINSDHLSTLGLAAMAGAGLSFWFRPRTARFKMQPFHPGRRKLGSVRRMAWGEGGSKPLGSLGYKKQGLGSSFSYFYPPSLL